MTIIKGNLLKYNKKIIINGESKYVYELDDEDRYHGTYELYTEIPEGSGNYRLYMSGQNCRGHRVGLWSFYEVQKPVHRLKHLSWYVGNMAHGEMWVIKEDRISARHYVDGEEVFHIDHEMAETPEGRFKVALMYPGFKFISKEDIEHAESRVEKEAGKRNCPSIFPKRV